MGQMVGYARVSSAGQSLDVQLQKLTAVGCDRIFQEKRSGRQVDNRPELTACLSYVRDGDTLVISRLDRAARSVLDLAKMADLLQRKGVALRVLDQGLDTSTSEGRLMFNLLGAFAEFESDIRKERQADGILMAKQKGVKSGRRPVLTAEQVQKLRRLYTESDFSVAQLQDRFAVSRTTVYRALGGVVRNSPSAPSRQL
jgi:DNA invertase Pin-like site-specific DNA recombinase